MDGLGVALALRPLVDSDIEEGRLVVPIERAVQTKFAYYLVTPEALVDHPAVSTFRRWLLAQAEGQSRRRAR
jgi:LysR family glycine cleavage system transcriptional activator